MTLPRVKIFVRLTVFEAEVIGNTGVRLKSPVMMVNTPECWDCISSYTSMIGLVAGCLSERGCIYTEKTMLPVNMLNRKRGGGKANVISTLLLVGRVVSHPNSRVPQSKAQLGESIPKENQSEASCDITTNR